MLKRTTTPVTVYKHQSLDRDDVIDITEIDVISWLKTEMRMMLDEEIARAILLEMVEAVPLMEKSTSRTFVRFGPTMMSIL